MRHYESCLSVVVAFLMTCRVISGVSDWAFGREKIGPHYPEISLLHDCTEEFKNLPSNKRIVSINNDKKFILLALVHGCVSEVWHCHFSLMVYDDFDLFFVLWFEWINVVFDKIPGLIFTHVINKHNMVVGVVLLQYRLDVDFVSVVFGVIKRGDNHTNWQLLVMTDFVLILKVLILLL